MWDIVGKPLEPMSKGKDCSGFINERPGGVAFNVAIGLSKILNKERVWNEHAKGHRYN